MSGRDTLQLAQQILSKYEARGVRNAEGEKPSPVVRSHLTDVRAAASEEYGVNLPADRFRKNVDSKGNVLPGLNADPYAYMTCRRRRTYADAKLWAVRLSTAVEFLFVALSMTGMVLGFLFIDSDRFAVTTWRDMMAGWAGMFSGGLLVSGYMHVQNAANEAMARRALATGVKVEEMLMPKVNFPDVRWGMLHQMLFVTGHWVNAIYLMHQMSKPAPEGGNDFPTGSDGLARFFRVRIWVFTLLNLLHVSIFAFEFVNLSQAPFWTGPIIDVDEKTGEEKICDPAGNFNYTGDVKACFSIYEISRYLYIGFQLILTYELLKQCRVSSLETVVWSPDTWRLIVAAPALIHGIMVVLLAVPFAVHLYNVPCVRGHVGKAILMHLVFGGMWLALWLTIHDFIESGRYSLSVAADIQRFENQLFGALATSAIFVYMNVWPPLRCYLNNGIGEIGFLKDFVNLF